MVDQLFWLVFPWLCRLNKAEEVKSALNSRITQTYLIQCSRSRKAKAPFKIVWHELVSRKWCDEHACHSVDLSGGQCPEKCVILRLLCSISTLTQIHSQCSENGTVPSSQTVTEETSNTFLTASFCWHYCISVRQRDICEQHISMNSLHLRPVSHRIYEAHKHK